MNMTNTQESSLDLSVNDFIEVAITAVSLMDVLDGDGVSLGSKLWLAYMGYKMTSGQETAVRKAFNVSSGAARPVLNYLKEKAQTFVGARLQVLPR